MKKILKNQNFSITSINKPNNVINKYIKLVKSKMLSLYLSQIRKHLFKNKNLKLLDLSIQQKLPFKFSKTILITVIQEKYWILVFHAFRCKNDL